MKISSIHIFGFGKFKDYKLDFSENFNLIYGQNENGKTTIAEFLKMMFYGNRPRVTDVFKNPRTKYKPLDGTAMAGSVTFEHSGSNYRLEREFRASNATDKITLYNLDLGTNETLSGKTDIGARFFGIGFGAFEKSVFISNSVAFENDSDADDDINSKLSNIKTTGDENVSFEAVAGRISAAMDEIKTKTGRGGSIVKLDGAILELDEELARQTEKLAERDALEKKIDEKKLLLEQLTHKKSDCFERLKLAEKYEIKAKLEEFVRIAEEFEKVEKETTLLDGSLPSKEYCDRLEGLITESEKKADSCITLSAEIERLTAEVSILEDTENGTLKEALEAERKRYNDKVSLLQKQNDEIKVEIIQCKEKAALVKPKINITTLILGVLLSLLAIFGGIFIEKFLFAFIGIGVILLSLSFVLKTKPNTAQYDLKLQELNQKAENTVREIEENTARVNELLEKTQEIAIKAATNESLLREKKNVLLSHHTTLLENRNAAATVLAEALELAGQFRRVSDIDTCKVILQDINNNLQEMSKLQIAAEYAAKGTGCKNLAEAKERLSFINANGGGSIGSLNDIKEELHSVTEEYNALSRELAALTAEARSAFSGLKVPAEYERQKSELLAARKEQSEYFEVLSLALDALTESFGEVRRSFSGELEARALKLLSGITDGKYNGISVSKNFDISVSDSNTFGTHGLEYLSKGAMHQAYFSLRLAMSELMGREMGALPVILDDAFSQYDDARLENALKFLNLYSENSQVIFFTCHNDCRRLAENVGAKIINL